jgi:death-on-curing protein
MIPPALQVAAILALHREAARYGGEPTERESDGQCVERSVAAAIMGAGYMAAGSPPNILHIAALSLFYLAKNHCFVDGNKRVAWMAITNYLLAEGLTVTGSTEELVEFVRAVADRDSSISREDVVEWLGADGRIVAAES